MDYYKYDYDGRHYATNLPDFWGAEARYRYAKSFTQMSKNLKKHMQRYFEKHKMEPKFDWDKIEIKIKPEITVELLESENL